MSLPLRLTYLALMSVPVFGLLFLSPRNSSQAAPAPLPRKPSVEVVFCLDTTGSMSGLIEGAKAKIWSVCNQIMNGRPMPNLRVGLVAFRDRGDDYVTKVFELRDDLDEVYADIRTFQANQGGDTPESVNQAIDDAVNKMNWSYDQKSLKIIFLVGDAPPHMDYADDTKYPLTCAKAVEKGIIINTIQCGNDAECTKFWKDICEKGNGSYVAIPQGGGVRGFSTEYDRRLSEINNELARSTIVYGDARVRESNLKKVHEAQSFPADIAADRAGYIAKEGKVARYDLLDSIRAGRIKLELLKDGELPSNQQKLSLKDRRDYIEKVAGRRAKLMREAADLDRQRSAAILKEMGKNKESFDSQVLDMLRKQSIRRIRY